MNDLLKEVQSRKKLNVSFPCEDIIEELKAVYEERGEIEVNVYYKYIDLIEETNIPIFDGVDYSDYPIFIDFLTQDEINQYGIDEDLKQLNCYKMNIKNAIELFEFQEQIIKS